MAIQEVPWKIFKYCRRVDDPLPVHCISSWLARVFAIGLELLSRPATISQVETGRIQRAVVPQAGATRLPFSLSAQLWLGHARIQLALMKHQYRMLMAQHLWHLTSTRHQCMMPIAQVQRPRCTWDVSNLGVHFKKKSLHSATRERVEEGSGGAAVVASLAAAGIAPVLRCRAALAVHERQPAR